MKRIDTADSTSAILGTTQVQPEKTWRPTRTFELGLPQVNHTNQIQQVKGVTSSNVGQGVPKPVTNVRVQRTAVGSRYKLAISYTRDPSDMNHTGVQVSITQGNGNPTVVASGTTSPITVLVDKSPATASITVSATGRWGTSTPISRALVLT